MIKLLLCIFALCCVSLKSQTYRFEYELRYKYDSLSPNYEVENMILDISKKETKFYDYPYLKYDSINKNTGSNIQTSSQTNQRIARDVNSHENRQYISVDFDYFVISSEDRIDWKIENETSYLSPYHVQKASAVFAGRKWIAWFTSEIPFSEGPYKFNGLPGLIVSIYDAKKNFIYTLLQSKTLLHDFNTSSFIETNYGIKPISISIKQYNKLLVDKYDNPYDSAKKAIESGGTVTINNQVIKDKSELDKLKKSRQEIIRKYYNPIELKNAVNYN
ncbi:GLPGLI family protein [Chryseobacterium piscicola]|nr:GLPGLI family protein [Chryseobacterium piscicola]PQA95034.1 hypothetical protein B0A70_06545 [Chryseobacterium piscicola]